MKNALSVLKQKLGLEEEKGEEVLTGPGFRDLIRPNRIENGKDYVKINDTFYRALMVEGFPRSIDNRFVSELLKNHSRMDISIRVSPYGQNEARRKVRSQLTKLEKDKRMKERTGEIAESIQNRLDDIRSLHKKLDKGEESLFDVCLNITTGADTRKGLKKNTENVRSELNKQQLIPGVPRFKMLQAFRSTLPTRGNEIQDFVDTQPRSMPSGAAAELFPFAGTPSSLEDDGVLLGVNSESRQPVLTDFYSSVNPNWMVLGTSGSGKSFAAKTILRRYACQGVQTFVLDPHGEYSETVQDLDGENIELSVKKGNMINPLDLMGFTFREKINSLKEFYSILLDGLSPSQMSKLVKATRRTYRSHGIYKDDPDSWSSQPPLLEDLLRTLEVMERNEGDRAQKRSYRALIDKLEPFVDGSEDFLNTRTTVEVRENVVNFDIEHLPESSYPELMHLVLNFLRSRMKEDSGDRKMVVVDEAWELLSESHGKADNSFVYRTVKSSRKYNLSLGLLVQEIHDLVNSRQGKAVLSNTANKILLGQDRAAADQVAERLSLNQKEKEMIRSSGIGEGLLLKEDQHIPLEVHGTEKEVQMEEDEKGGRNYEEAIEGADGLDLGEKVLKEEELSEGQVEALDKSGSWGKSNEPLFRGGFQKTRWVKTEGENSADHERLVYGYQDFLEGMFEKVRTSQKYADIEIETEDGEIFGLEVETGSNLEHNKEAFEDKVRRNDNRYDEWFIIVFRKELRSRYDDYGKVLLRTEVKDRVKELNKKN
ncbi:MAG: VirB4 family type IV secretion system protein [Candidatus Nanohalobium sp.]